MSFFKTHIFATVVLFWALLLIWLQAGFLAALAVAALADLGISIAGRAQEGRDRS